MKKLKFFLVQRNDHVDYDEYDAAVVCAQAPEHAIELLKENHGTDYYNGWRTYDVVVEELKLTEGIILESFNAG